MDKGWLGSGMQPCHGCCTCAAHQQQAEYNRWTRHEVMLQGEHNRFLQGVHDRLLLTSATSELSPAQSVP